VISNRELVVTLPSDHEVRHGRRFSAPRELVFAALTRPEVLARWYGPQGWKLVSCEVDLRAGGAWVYVTRQPSGREITQYGVYLEIVEPERLVYTEHWLDWDVGEVVVTTELSEPAKGETLLTLTSRFPSKQVRDQLLAAGADRGAREHYDKLEEFLSTARRDADCAP